MDSRTHIAIDLKSFYASAECVARGLDPLTARLVVADESRTDKTICLAVSPALKAFGIPGRPRLFEVKQRLQVVNAERRHRHLEEVDFIAAKPRMAHYMAVSAQVYRVYLQYIAPEDIHVYSIDEVFIDATAYLKTYRCTAHELTIRMIRDVLRTTGITATAGIGSNLYLAKIAMDIEAKHAPADADGVRIAELDELSYRQKYWTHRPLTDFWRIGHGIATRLEGEGLYTMGDIARCSLGAPGRRQNEELLYKLFGVNAELLIDHAWGWESCTMADIKAYRPATHSLSSGQVLMRPYPFDQAKLVTREMTEMLVLDLVAQHKVASQVVLSVSYERTTPYDKENIRKNYAGVNGSANLGGHTSSTKRITEAVMSLFDRLVDRSKPVRRLNVTVAHVVDEKDAGGIQLDLFDTRPADDPRERKRQEAILAIRKKYGKNAILKGMDFEEGATARERNQQIGGHRE